MVQRVKELRRKPMFLADAEPLLGRTKRRNVNGWMATSEGEKDSRPCGKALVNQRISAPASRGPNNPPIGQVVTPSKGASGVPPSRETEDKGIANPSVSSSSRPVRELLGIHNQDGAKRGSARGKPLEKPRSRSLLLVRSETPVPEGSRSTLQLVKSERGRET